MAFGSLRFSRSFKHLKKFSLYHPRRNIASNNDFLRISEEVREALHTNRPVVALETTIYTHGFPHPDNVALASELESIVRVNGGVPATIGILEGVAHVGLDPDDLTRLVSTAGHENTLKLSRRDLSYACGLRLADKKFNGGTTVAGTMILAHLAGIRVFATGGLGGVHRGAESSMDISADLTEMGRTPVAVVSSGCKSFLDIPKTLEYLETQGASVATFADGREGKVDFPAFWSRDSGITSPLTIQNEMEAAAMIHAQNQLQISSGLLLANPIPAEAAISMSENSKYVREAIRQANTTRIAGKENTPFVLSKIKELSAGRSVKANRVLIASNVKMGTLVAKILVELEQQNIRTTGRTEKTGWFPPPPPPAGDSAKIDPVRQETKNEQESNGEKASRIPSSLAEIEQTNADIIVAGALAVDYSCDFSPLQESPSQISPTSHTSNPAVISQSLGGVAHNIALTAHLIGNNVKFCSVVADDLAGRTALQQLAAEEMHAGGIRTVTGERTAQYVAVNDLRKDLVVAMADMGILERQSNIFTSDLKGQLDTEKPKWLVVDGNLSSDAVLESVRYAKRLGIRTAFEPVSTAKSARLFSAQSASILSKGDAYDSLPVFPNHVVDMATPNHLELAAMYTAAREAGHFDSLEWWKIIDALGIPSSGARSRFLSATSPELVDQGVPQQSVQLLPFIPILLTKLGAKGVLLTMLLGQNDERLRDGRVAPYLLSRSRGEDTRSLIGGVYMRLFPPVELLADSEIISVNGVGDTFLGAMIGAEVQTGKDIDELVDFAQRAATRTLRSRGAVCPSLKEFKGQLCSYQW